MNWNGNGNGVGGDYDTNVDNYSISELLDLVGLGGVSQIQENDFSHLISGLVEKYRNVDTHLSQFFADVGQRIYHWLNTSLAVGRADGDGGGDGGDGGGDGSDWEGDGDGDGDGDGREGFAMRSGRRERDGREPDGGEPDGAEVAEGGGYDDQMGGAGRVDPNDVMGLKRDANRGIVSGDQQLKWERNQYLDDDGEGGSGGGSGGGNGMYVNRSNKVKIFRDINDHYQMKQKKVGVANSYVVPVTQGTTNPILRNTLTRIINIDSQFRQSVFPYTTDPTSPTSATSFTVVLTEPLTNVTSLKLNSINIPYTWYTVDSAVGNNIMYIDMNTGVNGVHTVTVPNGNYSPAELVVAVRRQIGLNLYLFGSIDISYNTVNGLCFFMNYTSKVVSFTFYDAAMIYAGKMAGGCRQSTKLNNSLGWLLGFRNSNFYDGVVMANGSLPSGYDRTLNTFDTYGMVYMVLGVGDDMVLTATTGGKTVPEQVADSISGLYSDNNPANDASAGVGWVRGEAIVDCYGPQYFLLIIDDFNHSRVNSGVVGIGEVATSLARPMYFNANLPSATACMPDTADVRNGIKKQKLVVPLVPRTLTFSQIYTLNQITVNRGSGGMSGKNREMGPKTSDVFAVIPLRTTVGLTIGQHYIDYGPSLLTNQRAYFGPVVINKLRVTLRDDKGYIVNLHGNDWSFSLVTEELYEF
jgi:hypothetical protein